MYAFYLVFQSKVYQDNTPIATTKIIKNPVEVTGMKKSHVCIIFDYSLFDFVSFFCKM
jgi:hypothetical protein